jgi:hypothetical protein
VQVTVQELLLLVVREIHPAQAHHKAVAEEMALVALLTMALVVVEAQVLRAALEVQVVLVTVVLALLQLLQARL